MTRKQALSKLFDVAIFMMEDINRQLDGWDEIIQDKSSCEKRSPHWPSLVRHGNLTGYN